MMKERIDDETSGQSVSSSISSAFPGCSRQSRRRFQAGWRIFLVQSRRNQWLSRFACTKAAADFEPRGAFSWCKADVINDFPGLLAPKPPPISGGAVQILGAKPTQSMTFPGCLHQVRRRFQAARCKFLVQSLRNQWLCRVACTNSAAGSGRRSTGREASYFFRGFPFALVRFRNSCLRFPASSLRFRFAVLGFITEKPKKPRGSLLRA